MALFLPTCRPWTSPCWTSWGSCQPISLACWGPSGKQNDPLAYQSSLPVLLSSALSESTFCPIIQIIDEVKQNWMQFWPLAYTTSYWSPTGLCSTDHQLLGLAIQLIFNPPCCLFSSAWYITSLSMRILLCLAG